MIHILPQYLSLFSKHIKFPTSQNAVLHYMYQLFHFFVYFHYYSLLFDYVLSYLMPQKCNFEQDVFTYCHVWHTYHQAAKENINS